MFLCMRAYVHACIIYLMFLCNTTNTYLQHNHVLFQWLPGDDLLKTTVGRLRTGWRFRIRAVSFLISESRLMLEAPFVFCGSFTANDWYSWSIKKKQLQIIANSTKQLLVMLYSFHVFCYCIATCGERTNMHFLNMSYFVATHIAARRIESNHQEKTKVSQKAKHINSLKPKLSNDNQGGCQLPMFVEGHTSAGHLTRFPKKPKTPDGKWTRKSLAYWESNHFINVKPALLRWFVPFIYHNLWELILFLVQSSLFLH